jgi:Thiolase C-terminal domain-like
VAGFAPEDVDAAQIHNGFSTSVVYGLESYRFGKVGKAVDFIQDRRIGLDGALLRKTFGGSLGFSGIDRKGIFARSRLFAIFSTVRGQR